MYQHKKHNTSKFCHNFYALFSYLPGGLPTKILCTFVPYIVNFSSTRQKTKIDIFN